jgi:hypothetical protein
MPRTIGASYRKDHMGQERRKSPGLKNYQSSVIFWPFLQTASKQESSRYQDCGPQGSLTVGTFYGAEVTYRCSIALTPGLLEHSHTACQHIGKRLRQAPYICRLSARKHSGSPAF